jgi:hypothetical protein
MTAIARRKVFILFLAAGILFCAFKIGLLPLSKHAAESHLGKYSPQNIQSNIDQGLCRNMQVWMCPLQANMRILCDDGNIYSGLIVGLANPDKPIVVTGYAARPEYWKGAVKRDGCIKLPITY